MTIEQKIKAFVYISITMCMQSASRGQKRVSDHLGLELKPHFKGSTASY